MCHFITASLPYEADLKSIAPVFAAHKVGFELISNSHLTSQLDPKAWYILTSGKQCDCGTALGSLSRGGADKPVTFERNLKKFRQQGWSETKIERWLEQKEQHRERLEREDEALARSGDAELDRWVELLNSLLQTKRAAKFSLLLHWYQGRIESERIRIQRREKVRLSEVTSERLMRVEEDVLYEFVP